MKTLINTKYLVITTCKDDYDKFSFRMFKHEGSSFFERFSKVIEFTVFYRFVVIEF